MWKIYVSFRNAQTNTIPMSACSTNVLVRHFSYLTLCVYVCEVAMIERLLRASKPSSYCKYRQVERCKFCILPVQFIYVFYTGSAIHKHHCPTQYSQNGLSNGSIR